MLWDPDTQPYFDFSYNLSEAINGKLPPDHLCVLFTQTSDIGMTHNSGVSGLCFEIWFRRRKSEDTYTLKASSMKLKKAWTADLERILWDQAAHSRGSYNMTCLYTHYQSVEFTESLTSFKTYCEHHLCSRAANAGESVHGNGPKTVHGHSTQRCCDLWSVRQLCPAREE